MIAFQRSEPHWLLTDPDAARYAIAMGNALRHLPLQRAQKAVDFAAFAMVAFMIESPRVIRSAQLARTGARGPIPPGGAQVFRFTPAGGQAPPQSPPGGSGSPPGQAGDAETMEAPEPFARGPDGFGLADDFEPGG